MTIMPPSNMTPGFFAAASSSPPHDATGKARLFVSPAPQKFLSRAPSPSSRLTTRQIRKRGSGQLACIAGARWRFPGFSFERLCYTGLRGMGALEYVPSIGPDHSRQESLHIERLVELASQILTQRESISANAHAHGMEQIIEIGTLSRRCKSKGGGRMERTDG